jgi:hypothetical protein
MLVEQRKVARAESNTKKQNQQSFPGIIQNF